MPSAQEYLDMRGKRIARRDHLCAKLPNKDKKTQPTKNFQLALVLSDRRATAENTQILHRL